MCSNASTEITAASLSGHETLKSGARVPIRRAYIISRTELLVDTDDNTIKRIVELTIHSSATNDDER